jgi:AraC family transcriptional regulator
MDQVADFGKRIARHFLFDDAPAIEVRPLRNSTLHIVHMRSEVDDHGETVPPIVPQDAFILLLQRKQLDLHRYWVDGHEVPVGPFAKGATCIAHLLRNPRKYFGTPFDVLLFYIPRVALDELADQHDATRIEGLHFPDGFVDLVVGQLGESLLPAVDKVDAINTLFAGYVMLALVTHLARVYGGMQYVTHLARGGLTPFQVRRAKELLTTNLEAGLPLSAIARECGLSTSHFARAFKRTVGEPPHRWLAAYRVEQAKKLLLSSDTPLSEIALACGFGEQSYFTRAFSGAVGTSPGVWRRAHR